MNDPNLRPVSLRSSRRRTGRTPRWTRATFVLVAAALTAACSSTRPPPADPFAGGRSPARDGVRRHTVSLEVGCEGCDIQYWVGPERSNAGASSTWRRRLDLTPLQPTAIRLSATPRRAGAPVRWVRIVVDGEVVAESTCSACGDRTAAMLGDSRTTVSVETEIPLR